MKRIMQIFLRKDKGLYVHFKELSALCLKSAGELNMLLNEYNDIERSERKSRISSIKSTKLEAEDICGKIIRINDLGSHNNKFLLDAIASRILDACKICSAAATCLVGMGIERIDTYMTKFSSCVLQLSEELNKCVTELRSGRNLKEHCRNIHKLERQADDLYSEAISELFHFFKNTLDIVKYKSFYENLEMAADKIDGCAHLIERLE